MQKVNSNNNFEYFFPTNLVYSPSSKLFQIDNIVDNMSIVLVFFLISRVPCCIAHVGLLVNFACFENLFELYVQERNLHDGTMTCLGSGMQIEVPLDTNISSSSAYQVVQSKVTVGIRASDIILSQTDILGTSARNRLPGQVISIESRPPGFAVTLDCGQALRCNITGASMEEMNIKLGQTLWAVFKASSCFLVYPN